ncbi:MAG: hypothetical protein II897_04090 [Clostridia bacterium]|nr:hypothetical protein [Clostridia bacterium]
MKVTREEKKAEALKRMKAMGIFSEAIKQFDKMDKVNRSDPPYGAIYWVEDEELEAIRQFESEYNALVYYVVRAYTEFGTMNAYLYVSDYKEEWDSDIEGNASGQYFAYVRNIDYPELSEFGCVGLWHTMAGGHIRIW